MLLALLGKEQPAEDLHEWNLKNVYRGIGTRDKAKERIFAWLYNPQSKDYLSGRLYERGKILQEHWDGMQVTTPFHRVIEADEKHALNYLIQSTTADLVLRQMITMNQLLKKLFLYGLGQFYLILIMERIVLQQFLRSQNMQLKLNL